jgi:putative nucleotidyltransferase with HDIG domain
LKNDFAIKRLERELQDRPNDARLHFQIARAYMEVGEWTSAVRHLDRAVGLDKTFYAALFDFGCLHTRLRNYDMAVREWQKMVDEDGDLVLEGIDYSRPFVAAALNEWERYAAEGLHDIFKAYNVGIAMLVLGQPQKALTAFDTVVEANPGFEKVRYYRGLACVRLGRFPQAAEEFMRIVEARPRDHLANYWIGSCLLDAGRTAQAMTYLQKAIQERPRFAKPLVRLAAAYESVFQYEQAIATLRKAIEASPKNARAHLQLARCYEKQYLMDQAVETYLKAVELQPELKEAHFQLGLLLRNLGRAAEALHHLQKTVEIDPNEAEAHYYMGVVLAALGRHKEAIEEYRSALELAPNHADAHYSLGQSLLAAGRLDEAVGCLRKALALNPSDTHARAALGMAYFHQGRLALAVPEFRTAVQQNPRDMEAHYFLGASLLKLGEPLSAVKEFQKAAEVSPDSALHHFIEGATALLEEEYEKAKDLFQKAVDLRPDSEKDLGTFATLQLLGIIGMEHAVRGEWLQRYTVRLERAYLHLVEAMARILDAKDPYTHFHSYRVARITHYIAEYLARQKRLTPEQVKACHVGAYLHDIGKMAIPDAILCKEGPLTAAERAAIKRHPEKGVEMLKEVPFPWERDILLAVIRHHHEKWDGTGYPDGLKGDEIPLPAQIVGVADFYDALTTDRPYRAALTPHQALTQMKKMTGSFFNPEILAAFEAVLDQLLLDPNLPSHYARVESGSFSTAFTGKNDGLSVSWEYAAPAPLEEPA